MRPKGLQPKAERIFGKVYPLEEPIPITQFHKNGAGKTRPRVAMTVINVGTEKNPIAKRVPVCRHRCTFINMRHGSKADRVFL